MIDFPHNPNLAEIKFYPMRNKFDTIKQFAAPISPLQLHKTFSMSYAKEC